MGRRARFIDLARRLRRAMRAADWSALAALDREVAQALRSTPRLLPSQERAALADLQRAHREARERCAQEAARLDTALSQMRQHRDGWMAYAMSNSHDLDTEEIRR